MRVVLGVTGCIGAYKSALILRLLQQEGFTIIPVLTQSAQEFIGAVTLEKLSGQAAITGLFDSRSSDIEHISVARSSELLLVAPATANILGKFAAGIADDFLSTLYLSTTTPVIVAPAMNLEMWKHPAVQNNLDILRSRGVGVVEPGVGYQACGEHGPGRLAEPEEIVAVVLKTLGSKKSLLGKNVLVTAGPTVEDLDPVRFLSNRSSGKMGYAIAAEAEARGASVHLITGPTALDDPSNVHVTHVRSASEMADATLAAFGQSDVVIKAAAVADYTVSETLTRKLKKKPAKIVLQLAPTQDILLELGRRKERQLLVGFAAETDELLENAQQKLKSKNLDLIVANDVLSKETGFEVDVNEVTIVDSDGGQEVLPRLPKKQLASRLWDRIESLLAEKEETS